MTTPSNNGPTDAAQTPAGPAAAVPASAGPTMTPRGRGRRDDEGGSFVERFVRELSQGSFVITLLAIVAALVVGAILIVLTNKNVQATSAYFFSRPGDTFRAVWDLVSGAYAALFRGGVYNWTAPTFWRSFAPLANSLTFATPLIAGGLGVALAFRAGLFNIGGQGQILLGAAAAGWVGFSFDLPWFVHLPLAIAAGIAAGALWGAIVGVLKARTGAHEVILTIMLNYVAYYLLSYLLKTQGLLQAPGSTNEKSPAMLPSATFGSVFGSSSTLHWGVLTAVVATVVVWWLLNRSSLGFRFRAVGENPRAARVAGISVNRIYVWSMLLSGAFLGLAGVDQALGTVKTGITSGIDSGIGFDAITVALLGRNRPGGVLLAGVLFGVLKSGGYAMQSTQGVQVPIDIISVLQSVIVLFIAAPPLVRTIFFLPGRPRRRRSLAAEVASR